MTHWFSKCLSDKLGDVGSGTVVWGKVGAQSHGHRAMSVASRFPHRDAQGHLLPQSLEVRLLGLFLMV